MSDTIELLETIGRNAALRHASAEELALTLDQADASDALKAAAMFGDSSPLSAELGQKPMHATHVSQGTGDEDDEPDDGDDGDDSSPPSKPEPDQPSRQK